MKRISCTCEADVSKAARTGCWDDSTKAHVEQCAHCREIAGIAGFMGHIARADALESVLPAPEQVFFKARAAATQSAGERALRPLAIAEFAIRVMVALALAAVVLWAWFGIRSLGASPLASYLRLPQPVWISLAGLATGLMGLCITKVVQPILIEE